MSKLPKGWAEARIGDLAELNPKQAFDDETVAGFVPMSHAPTNFRDKLRFDERPWGEIKKAYTNFKDGDVIFAKVTPCFENGKAALVAGLPNGIGAGSSEFFVLRPSCNEMSAKYLLGLVKSYDFLREGAANMTGAVGLRRVPKQFVESYPVLVPPAAEQARITAKLDELLAQADTLQARIDAIPALLKRFRQSVLSAAVSGRLTEEWRAGQVSPSTSNEPAPPGWAQTVFGEICREITVGYVGKMADQYRDEGVPFLRSQNVRPMRFSPENILHISEEFHSSILKSRLEPGDLAIVRSGAPGVTCVIPKSLPTANCSDLVIARPSEKLNSWFGSIYMNSEVAKRNVADNQVGVAQQHFNVGSMKKMPIRLPPLEEQTEIVRRVEQLFAFADQLEAKVASAKSRIDYLTQSILAKAFRGELVAQDPNDEPASALLERIQAQRAAAPKAKRGRKASA
ncbi:restriction endonuclease subunit S [Pseudomonas sp. URMO17WK12:I4]|uniref:restriction endonuclease subunit S n=1 Tax=Pseudomonas sp. URMO17WK12:I4 TaxID=1283292 RepID=UPI0004806E43|nr:restriction endonuclease subunit S [Pseudomonas sp. URMO17WK12:I4]